MPRFKTVSRWVLGAAFVLAGVNHFANPAFYVRIMPPYLPWHAELVFVSGVCEAGLGVAVLVPRLVVPAAWGLIALLIAVFPANIHMALHADQYSRFPPAVLWARLPLQGVLVAWVYWYTRDSNQTAPAGPPNADSQADPR